ncbi:MAG TPA: hypothetical protein VG929_10740 [Actinomycetota bacterium]|nr:hypothetical protein [Actinomycetota bacterium]
MTEEATLRIGLTNLGYAFREFGRFPGEVLWGRGSRAKLSLHETPALLTWALLEPLFLLLSIPFELRGPKLGQKSSTDDQKSWRKFEVFRDAVTLDIDMQIGALRDSRWHELGADEQLNKKLHLIEAMTDAAQPGVAARFRSFRLRPLLERYYKKADTEGRALRKSALTNALEPTLSAYFQGDWLSFLRYIGENPHPAEEILTSLPEAKLYVAAPSRVDEVAAAHGVSPSEIEKMLAAFWNQESATSPLHRRVDALREFWKEFDRLHSLQKPGDRSLWGLVDERYFTFSEAFGESPRPGLYRDLMPPSLVQTIDELWGTCVLPRFPDRIVGEAFPHAVMADAFGPALHLWQEVGLTTWFFSEGPYSRTDLAGLGARCADDVAALEKLGTPVPRELFEELKNLQRSMPEPEMEYEEISSQEVAGISLTFSMGGRGVRRGGFEKSREIVSRYRKEWAEAHLETYLTTRWQTELRETARSYALMREDKGKTPTAKQFAKHATGPANHWFGGELSQLYAAMGEKSPVAPLNEGWFPDDRLVFAWSVYVALGGPPFGKQPSGDRSSIDKSKLALKSFDYLQLEQALGRQPTLKDFTVSRFQWDSKILSDDIEVAWEMYVKGIQLAKENPTRFPGWSDWKSKPRPSSPSGVVATAKSEPRLKKKGIWDRIKGK